MVICKTISVFNTAKVDAALLSCNVYEIQAICIVYALKERDLMSSLELFSTLCTKLAELEGDLSNCGLAKVLFVNTSVSYD